MKQPKDIGCSFLGRSVGILGRDDINDRSSNERNNEGLVVNFPS